MQTSAYFDIQPGPAEQPVMEVYLDGVALLRLVLTNKGTAFTAEERVDLGLDGLLPPQINTLEQQVARVYRGFKVAHTPIEQYQYLRAVQERQEILFYALLDRYLEEMLPIVYTPTVGQAVQEFSALYQSPRGISLSSANIDRADAAVASYPLNDVRMMVVTDSSAILGIGDQGYGGLAIPIGKLALYTVAGGVSPFHTMPVALDVGTERVDLIDDPTYLGVRHNRLTGDEYDAFIEKFVSAVEKRWPRAVIQWEDLSKESAFRVLERYRTRIPSFNDDIQGTGAVALAGVLGACALKEESITEQTVVIHGAGAGGAGVAWAMRQGMMRAGLSEEEAAARVLVIDSRGLLVSTREMEAYKLPVAQAPERIAEWSFAGTAPDLLETITQSGATVLLGLSGRQGAFGKDVAVAMQANAERPTIFAMSNPTSASEAHPGDILRWTHGKAIVATGSPFDPVELNGKTYPIGQGNNAFIFPGLGFGAVLCAASQITDGMVLAASEALADFTREHYLRDGRVYPPVSDLQSASKAVAVRVIQQARADGVAKGADLPEDLKRFVDDQFWEAKYLPVRRKR